jgi:hypothetical protein
VTPARFKWFGSRGHADVLCGAGRCAGTLGTWEPPSLKFPVGYEARRAADGDVEFVYRRGRGLAALRVLIDPARPPLVVCRRCDRRSFVAPPLTRPVEATM